MYKLFYVAVFVFPVICQGEVFKCNVDGVVAFQDEPCRYGVSERLELKVIAPADPPPKTSYSSSSSSKTTPKVRKHPPDSRVARKEAKQHRCDDAKDRYKLHRSKMRAGYGHKKSNDLREKERLLKAKMNRMCR